MKIEKSLLSNRNNPHYIIAKGNINIITTESEIVDFLPFKDSSFADKYAKKLGKRYFATFASTMIYDYLIKNKMI